jgi:hypothetical protein
VVVGELGGVTLGLCPDDTHDMEGSGAQHGWHSLRGCSGGLITFDKATMTRIVPPSRKPS